MSGMRTASGEHDYLLGVPQLASVWSLSLGTRPHFSRASKSWTSRCFSKRESHCCIFGISTVVDIKDSGVCKIVLQAPGPGAQCEWQVWDWEAGPLTGSDSQSHFSPCPRAWGQSHQAQPEIHFTCERREAVSLVSWPGK